ncbi:MULTISPECIES: translation elongation factor 4 [Blautia]|jgi:GTP-binding protein LepA|uniref:Elongation factor 4 n=3 Tax=Bacteria TaxID=2 RepID=D4LUT6_9FIRM|nr:MULTISPECIES: translation elongation factor 4 [Blautia]RHD34076.1 elongation factor 4 [Blautia obeum]CBL24544.1 GTP-binding protein LepA [Blautia obeum A2-162]
MIDQSKIRNFCIIAHIDHGKSTLADRIIEQTGTLTEREMQSQVLDNMELERERGITIKSQAVRIVYKASDGEEYIFNLIDTPGHVDFNYEVSRSLAACDGAVLVVDAAQGIEAQTLANVYLALDHDLDVLPVINKIDLPSADPDRVVSEIEDVIGLEAEDAPRISAKTGLNIGEVLEQIVTKIPAPCGDVDAPLKALIFDSIYDAYKGVIVFCRIMDGRVKKGTQIRMMATGFTTEVVEVGYFGAGQFIPCDELTAGMVGYITASIKNLGDTRVGDTVTDNERPCAEALPGYKKVQPMVYCGLYPADGAKYGDLRDALEKLQLNDASLFFEPETSIALGFGFRCGFLGLLHLEIIQERLEREYNLDLVTTAPGVVYKVYKTNGDVIELTNPSNLPDPSEIEYMEEPMVNAEIMVTTEFIGAIMDLCQERRGQYEGMEYMEETRALLKYKLPLNEIIYDFFDALKSRSRGYASLDYELCGYERSELVKLDILVNKEEVDALSFIVHADTAYERGRKMCEKLKEEIPRQLFEIPIQAAIGSKIIARETVRAMRKDVLAKCYGGDISRKKKLLEKQKEGKKRMRQVGNVEIPQKAFMSVLKLDDK